MSTTVAISLDADDVLRVEAHILDHPLAEIVGGRAVAVVTDDGREWEIRSTDTRAVRALACALAQAADKADALAAVSL